MNTAKIFVSKGNQTVRLPKDFRFDTDEVIVQRLGGAVLLVPKSYLWQTFTDGLAGFTDDAFEDGRGEERQEERGTL